MTILPSGKAVSVTREVFQPTKPMSQALLAI